MEPMMRDAVQHSLVQNIIVHQAAMARQDFAEVARILIPDVTCTVPRANALSRE